MCSDNVTSGDDQQETAGSRALPTADWITGFVDGEGFFSISIHKNAGAVWGWQLCPVFQVSQHVDHVDVLEDLRVFFGCGHVRSKGAGSSVWVYAIHAVREIESAVLPFFGDHPLRVKLADFEKFATVVRAIRRQGHWRREVFEELVRLAYTMNANGKHRARPIEVILAGSSETVRQARLL